MNKQVEFRHNSTGAGPPAQLAGFSVSFPLGYCSSPFPTAVDDANNGHNSRRVKV